MPSVANTLKSADQLNELVGRLYNCTTAEQVSGIFEKYQIDAPEDKRELLHRCMDIE